MLCVSLYSAEHEHERMNELTSLFVKLYPKVSMTQRSINISYSLDERRQLYEHAFCRPVPTVLAT